MTAWIIIYIILGILTFLLLKKETKTNQLTAIENIFTFLITVLLFPISIILLVKNKIKPSALNKKHKVNLFNEQINIVRTFTKHSKNEINDESLNKSILDFQKGNFIYDISLKRLIESVEYFLTTGKEPPKEPDGSGVQKDGTIVMYQTVRVGWFFAMTNEFM
ncbi:MAG TPA: hypothetical protein PKE38_17125, partial [Ignavibacteriaceae bacterium]|nr:hypothetical protein [Ignavibacteriaceae bacterium]